MMTPYSIGIVTYIKRYENYFKPLINQIKFLKPDVEIIVCINGEHNKPFDEQYRSEILRFLSNYNNVFPSFYPEFRSLSKLWNTCLINSTKQSTLLLNDDLTINAREFFIYLENAISENKNKSFKINGSWSHVYLNRNEVSEVGWFDERYLGVGEEDEDFEWRWNRKFNTPFNNCFVPGIVNHVEQDDCLDGIVKVNNKYSKFNHDFAYKTKYRVDPEGQDFGIMDKKLVCAVETLPQHLSEKFYWDNKHLL